MAINLIWGCNATEQIVRVAIDDKNRQIITYVDLIPELAEKFALDILGELNKWKAVKADFNIGDIVKLVALPLPLSPAHELLHIGDKLLVQVRELTNTGVLYLCQAIEHPRYQCWFAPYSLEKCDISATEAIQSETNT